MAKCGRQIGHFLEPIRTAFVKPMLDLLKSIFRLTAICEPLPLAMVVDRQPSRPGMGGVVKGTSHFDRQFRRAIHRGYGSGALWQAPQRPGAQVAARFSGQESSMIRESKSIVSPLRDEGK
jgi:hypothetical protein